MLCRVQLCIALTLGISLPSVSVATELSDDFEAYTTGTFPSPPWSDVADVSPSPPVPPDLSVTVVQTTDASSNPTKAASFVGAVSGTSQGIFQSISVSQTYELSVDFRIDQFSNGASESFEEWPFQAGFVVNDGTAFSAAKQVGIYVSSDTHDFRLFAINDQQSDVGLGASPTLGTWYHLDFVFDSSSGEAITRIADLATGAVLVSQPDQIPNWDPNEAEYDAAGFFDGDAAPGTTVANLAVWDNVHVIPEPSSTLILIAGHSALLALGRNRRVTR